MGPPRLHCKKKFIFFASRFGSTQIQAAQTHNKKPGRIQRIIKYIITIEEKKDGPGPAEKEGNIHKGRPFRHKNSPPYQITKPKTNYRQQKKTKGEKRRKKKKKKKKKKS